MKSSLTTHPSSSLIIINCNLAMTKLALKVPYYSFAFSRDSAINVLQKSGHAAQSVLARLTNQELGAMLRDIKGLAFTQCSGVFNTIPEESLDADLLIEKTKQNYCLNAYYRLTLGITVDVLEHASIYYDTMRNR